MLGINEGAVPNPLPHVWRLRLVSERNGSYS